MADQPQTSASARHEDSDVNVSAILGFGLGLLVTVAVASMAIFGLFRYFDGREGVRVPAEYPLAASHGRRVPPEPRLQTDPRQDMSDLRAKEDDVLGSYGWVDRSAGVVRIPIDVAMKLTLERGLPARQTSERER